MCGIAGFCDFTKKSTKKTLIEMTDILHHRGPDDSGYSFIENNFSTIGLGHRRLSILDLSSHGHQPMEFNNLEIVYNGEIYNFKEIRNELEKYAYSFESNSDTEVILKAYHKWGIKFVKKLNGMFAIAIYDKEKEELVFIRDRIGKKPLYYYYDNDCLIFASEIKSILKSLSHIPAINNKALVGYLQFGYIGKELTIYSNIYKLEKSSYMKFDVKNRKLDMKKYVTKIDFDTDFSNYDVIKKDLKSLLIDSVEKRMISDVSFGSFLSGGIDSSLITSIMSSISKQKVKTFTIGFDEKNFNEANYAKDTAKFLNTEHYEYYFDENDLINSIDFIIENMDEPFADQSILPTYLLSKFTKEKVTVALSGDGGDELFCGYNHYFKIQKLYKIYNLSQGARKIMFSPLLFLNTNKPLKIYNGLTQQDLSMFQHYIMNYWSNQDVSNLLKTDIAKIDYYSYDDVDDLITKAMEFDKNNFLVDDVMVKVDRASMLASLETRAPLLDYRIEEFSKNIPLKFKCNSNGGKNILKDILNDFLPKELWDRKKSGFVIPLKKWLSGKLKDDINRVCSEEFIVKQNLFKYAQIQNILNEHYSGKYFRTSEIWSLYIFQKWWEKHYGY